MEKEGILRRGNLIFCFTGSQENYFGLVGLQNDNKNPEFAGSTSRNKKSIDP